MQRLADTASLRDKAVVITSCGTVQQLFNRPHFWDLGHYGTMPTSAHPLMSLALSDAVGSMCRGDCQVSSYS